MKAKPAVSARILNVDDNEIGRYTKTRILQQAGFDVIEAGNGADALRAVKESRPQLVLLDVQLPDMSGFEIARRIKGDPMYARLPVLHITATGNAEESEIGSLESGADIFLAQPVEPQELITVVRTLLRLHTTEVGLAESEERMRLATEGAGIATWDIDLRDNSAHWSRQFYALVGCKQGGPSTAQLWLDLIHPEDREAVSAAMEEARRNGTLFNREHRILRKSDEAERWLAPYGKVHADETGQPTRFMGVVVDITSRKREEVWRDQLLKLEQRARSEAENVARLKDEFLATLSHELRSPMSAILGWLHLMRTGRLTEEQHAKAIETIERNAHLQNQLINDLLDVSRVIAGKLDLVREAGQIDDVIEGSIASVRVSAQGKGIAIETALEHVPDMHYDAARLQQVFVNLLSNAVKFTPSGGRIDVRARKRGGSCEVEVADTGEGIEPQLLPYLFERFRQADGSTTRRHGGLGLGLAIVRHIVELHGGSVSAESPGKGKGATFRVKLPIGTHAVVSARAFVKAAPAARVEPDVGSASRLKGVKVLVTDDEASARGLMSQVLVSEGADVMTASNAKEAVAICTRWRPAVLVLDIGMPGEDGYALLGNLRGKGAACEAPAIAVTGYARDEDRERALSSGFQAHISKPYDIEELIKLIRSLARQ
ncbi:MAG TPA: response regulator [Burkholderiales bacterium]|nr:response regulator [Burkholderiales bacterium]